MSNLFRRLYVMYNKHVFRKSREYKIDLQCSELEKKWRNK